MRDYAKISPKFWAGSESGRVRIEGPDAVVAHLSKPGPGDLGHWEAREWPTGIAATFEAWAPTAPLRRSGASMSARRKDTAWCWIIGTPKVTELLAYESVQHPETRRITFRATVNTAYGQASVEEPI